MKLVLLRSQPTPNPDRGGELSQTESGGKKEEEREIEGESFLFSWRKTHVNGTRQVKSTIQD
ncbi:MAG: hypothetical protein F6K18_20455 [Okeania sp. SIO2C2]|uniref:hypothetical protein n=1 Tax=Okeania sp. SIO2C2 TaxID=2607787 RepID=UPI0013BBF164|nr:hypothetical protein [Okeania sp. SIO2C2]NEP89009.1 hypothetical protein [Okeania sp. SIO2C2]